MLMTFNHRTFSVAMCLETLWGKYLVTHLPVWIKPESHYMSIYFWSQSTSSARQC